MSYPIASVTFDPLSSSSLVQIIRTKIQGLRSGDKANIAHIVDGNRSQKTRNPIKLGASYNLMQLKDRREIGARAINL
jgi:hypothetical protein